MGAHVRVHNQLAQGRDARVAQRMDKGGLNHSQRGVVSGMKPNSQASTRAIRPCRPRRPQAGDPYL